MTATPRCLAATAALAFLSGCGGSSTSSTPAPTSAPVVIFSGGFPLGSFQGAFADFAIPGSGTVRATIDWTFLPSDVDVYFFAGTTCTDFERYRTWDAAPGCVLLAPDFGSPAKPTTISFDVRSAQTARVFVFNPESTSESVRVHVTLTR